MVNALPESALQKFSLCVADDLLRAFGNQALGNGMLEERRCQSLSVPLS